MCWRVHAPRYPPSLRLLVPIYAGDARIVPNYFAPSRSTGTVYTTPDYTAPTAFLVVAEDEGLNATWRSLADTHVAIPMDEGAAADSLNASAAAALLLYEAVRQRA